MNSTTELKQQLAEMQDAMFTFQDKKSAFKTELMTTQMKMQTLKDENQLLRQEQVVMSEIITDQDKRLSRLTRQVEESEMLNGSKLQLKNADIDALSDQLLQYEAQMKKQQQMLDQKQQELAQQQQITQEKSRQIQLLDAQLASANSLVKQQEQQFQADLGEIQSLWTQDVEAIRADHQQQLNKTKNTLVLEFEKQKFDTERQTNNVKQQLTRHIADLKQQLENEKHFAALQNQRSKEAAEIEIENLINKSAITTTKLQNEHQVFEETYIEQMKKVRTEGEAKAARLQQCAEELRKTASVNRELKDIVQQLQVEINDIKQKYLGEKQLTNELRVELAGQKILTQSQTDFNEYVKRMNQSELITNVADEAAKARLMAQSLVRRAKTAIANRDFAELEKAVTGYQQAVGEWE